LSRGNADFKKGFPTTPDAFMACGGALFLTFQLLSFSQNIAGGDSEVGVMSLRAGSPGMNSRMGARFFVHFQTDPGAHSAFCIMSAG